MDEIAADVLRTRNGGGRAWLSQIAVGGKRAAVGTSIAVLILVPFAGLGIASAKPRFRDGCTRPDVA